MNINTSPAEVAKIVAAMRSAPNVWPTGLADIIEKIGDERNALAAIAIGAKNAAAAIRELKAERDDLNAKLAKLRAALKPFADRVPKPFIDGAASEKSMVALAGSPLGDYRNAHAAMEETK